MNDSVGEEKLVYAMVRKRRELFLRGPVPLLWLQRAAKLGGSALDAGIMLWYRRGLSRGMPFKIGNQDLSLCGKSKDTGRRALRALAKSGLIRVTRMPGQKAQVEVLPADKCTGGGNGAIGDSDARCLQDVVVDS